MCNGNCSGGCAACEFIDLGGGRRGLPGQAATVAVGTTTTGDPGTDAQVTNAGTPQAALLNFVIPRGDPGDDGIPGRNAFTTTTAPFITPAANGNGTVIATVLDNTWMVNFSGSIYGQTLFIEGAGYYRVAGLIGTTQVILINRRNDDPTVLSYQENAAPGVTIPADSRISPGGIQGPRGLQGNAASVAVGTTTTLAAGNPASVVNVGTPEAAVLNFGIPAGLAGAAGHTPVFTQGPGTPSGGVSGDWYMQQVNPGLLRVWSNVSGTWTAGNTIVSNRLVGFGTSAPSGFVVNERDTYWQTGVNPTLWVYSGGVWTILFTIVSGGGGGNLPSVIAASGPSFLAGPIAVNWQRTNFNIPAVYNHTSPGATYAADTNIAYHDITLSANPIVLSYVDPPSGSYSEWVFMIFNNQAIQANINYATGKWRKNPALAHPTHLLPNEWAILHCYFYKGDMIISAVEVNTTYI